MVGILEAFSGVGLILGSTGGSAVFRVIGFKATYFLFGGLFPVLAIITRIALMLIEMREEKVNTALEEPLLLTNNSRSDISAISTNNSSDAREPQFDDDIN